MLWPLSHAYIQQWTILLMSEEVKQNISKQMYLQGMFLHLKTAVM